MIEIVDPDEGAVLLSQRVDPLIFGFVDDETVFAYREDTAGRILTDIWRLRIDLGEGSLGPGGIR